MNEWMERAACADSGQDEELWFPPSYLGPAAEAQVAEAKAVCRVCPVVSDCLAFAIEHRLRDGIFGGHTPRERPKPKPRKGGKPRPSKVDEVIVDRVIAGKPVGRKLHKEERVAVADIMLASGRTITAAAMAVGCSNTTMRGLVA